MKGVTKSKYAFKYRTLKSFIDDVEELGYSIPVSGSPRKGFLYLNQKSVWEEGQSPTGYASSPSRAATASLTGVPGNSLSGGTKGLQKEGAD